MFVFFVCFFLLWEGGRINGEWAAVSFQNSVADKTESKKPDYPCLHLSLTRTFCFWEGQVFELNSEFPKRALGRPAQSICQTSGDMKECEKSICVLGCDRAHSLSLVTPCKNWYNKSPNPLVWNKIVFWFCCDSHFKNSWNQIIFAESPINIDDSAEHPVVTFIKSKRNTSWRHFLPLTSTLTAYLTPYAT